MAVYWILLLIPCIAAIGLPPFVGNSLVKRSFGFGYKFYFFLLFLFVGWRHEVGGDWGNYVDIMEYALHETFAETLSGNGDPAYVMLNWISAQTGAGIYGVNLVCAFVFTYGLMVFCHYSPRPWLSIAVAVPYLVIVVAMGYTRQGVAIGLIMLALVALDKGNIAKFLAWVVLSALFHKTALILIPMAIFASRKNWIAFVGALLTVVLLFFLLLAEYVDIMIANYITVEYSSSGAAIRIFMNALPATVFLVFRKLFDLTDAQKTFWTWMSIGGLVFIGLLALSPSSTAVDRVALYWIPLQLYVWSRWPGAMARTHNTQLIWVSGVLIYSLAVQFVWLFFADNRNGWIPYQFYPWLWLWQ